MYDIVYSPRAVEDLKRLKRNEPAAYKKASKFIEELKEHPKTGLGHPEPGVSQGTDVADGLAEHDAGGTACGGKRVG